VSPSICVLHKEDFKYTSSVTCNSATLAAIPFYGRAFNAPANFSLCTISLCIPFTGNDTATSRSRVLVYLDSELIYDATMYGQVAWQLVPINIHAYKVGLACGQHSLNVYACVDKGNLNIPHYNSACIEGTTQPSLSGSLTIIANP
jgi:hypothetical protein